MKKTFSVISVLLICVTLASFLLIPAGAVPVSDEYEYRIYLSDQCFFGKIGDFVLNPAVAVRDLKEYDVCVMLQYDLDTVALIYTKSNISGYHLSVFQDEFGDFYFSIGSTFLVSFFDLSFDSDYPDKITGVTRDKNVTFNVGPGYYQDDFFHKLGCTLDEYRSYFLATTDPIFWEYQDQFTSCTFFYENPSDTVLTKPDDRYCITIGSGVDQDGIGIVESRYDPDTYFVNTSKCVFYKGALFETPPADFSYDSVVLIKNSMLQFTVVYYTASSFKPRISRWPDLSQDPLSCYKFFVSGSAYVCVYESDSSNEDPMAPVNPVLVSSELKTSPGLIFYAASDGALRSMFLVSNQPIHWGFMNKVTSNVFFHENPYGNKLSAYNDDFGASGVEPSTPSPDDPSNILEWIQAIFDEISSLPSAISVAIGDALSAIPQAITDGLSALFVPDEEAVLSRYNYIRGKFSFVDSIISVGDYLLKFFQGLQDPDAPPVIYIDFSFAESKYDYGGRAVALDFSWYSKYKPTVDTLLSSLMWVFFAWRLFVHAPSIISGMSGSVEASGELYKQFDSNRGKYEKPARYIGRFERGRK